MSEYELTSLIYDLFRDMDSMVEFWITVTFALVVAAFVGRAHLSPRMLAVMVSIYLIASAQWCLRWVVLLRRTLHYRDELASQGHSDIPTDPLLIAIIVILILIMFVVGISTVLLFIKRSMASTDASSLQNLRK